MLNTTLSPQAPTTRLSADIWQGRRAAHRQRMGPWVADRQLRSGKQAKHPVYDFLFEYYGLRPSHLLRWSPGADVVLENATPEDVDWPEVFHTIPGGMVLDAADFPKHRQKFLRWGIDYLEAIAGRPPQLGCFGLHEWAMVYRETDIRHNRIPLRLSRSETDAVVEVGILSCTHYDAYRFFTPAAVPRNRQELSRVEAPQHDQPGCVHVNMDLYKWAFQIAPFCSGELMADAFELAIAARELDMRASPYDLSAFGFTPIRIETRAGRDEYVEGQREIAKRGMPIRERLVAVYRSLRGDSNDMDS